MTAQKRHLPSKKRRVTIVESVVELAAFQNPTGITTAAIAGHMGLTQGALFRHFASKEEILQAVMEWVAERLLPRVEKAAQAAPPLAALEAVFMTHVDFVIEWPGVPRILFAELQRAEDSPPKRVVQSLIQRYGEQLQRLIEAGKANGDLDPRLDTEAAASLFIGTIQGLVMQSLLAGDVNRMRQEAPKVFAIYRRGIRNSSPGLNGSERCGQ
ncbi:TetR family transcriptional regulator [Geothermobacter hydrogeniphilus]|uniref:TetR family transcriptional regulator n=1 Tax=Geothermobacter hydrogeniphilus TaxID=1969733 RepID=A0A2K2HBB1_9BACT|nr:TetR/AcrR family transcriptional regulator [Geothermobacter hydrogeniphilus]PNU20551.1 TetR family transcriptional regulator [Geothermobacter hydrogeniphilus]